jgi:hypothetical protein
MDTPLNRLFFSPFNISLLQKAIRQDFKDKTGIAIDHQNDNDLIAIMRAEFVNSSGDPHRGVESQVRMMNSRILQTARSQIGSGVSQFINFMKDTESTVTPLDHPKSTTTYGNKLSDQEFGI